MSTDTPSTAGEEPSPPPFTPEELATWLKNHPTVSNQGAVMRLVATIDALRSAQVAAEQRAERAERQRDNWKMWADHHVCGEDR